MKQYLMDTFKFNDPMNTKLLAKIKALPDKQQCIKFFNHLINSQNKWLARITQYPQGPKMDWCEPVYALDDLEYEWGKSLRPWIEFIGSKSEDDLFAEVKFIGYDGGHWACKLKDIALQLNCHSIHHRARVFAGGWFDFSLQALLGCKYLRTFKLLCFPPISPRSGFGNVNLCRL